MQHFKNTGGKKMSTAYQKVYRHIYTTSEEELAFTFEYGRELLDQCYRDLSDWKEDKYQREGKHWNYEEGYDMKAIKSWVLDEVLSRRKSQIKHEFIIDKNRRLSVMLSCHKDFKDKEGFITVYDDCVVLCFGKKTIRLYYFFEDFREKLTSFTGFRNYDSLTPIKDVTPYVGVESKNRVVRGFKKLVRRAIA